MSKQYGVEIPIGNTVMLILWCLAGVWAQETFNPSIGNQWSDLETQIKKGPSDAYLSKEVLNSQALIHSADRDPLDVVKRRTAALLESNRRLGKTTAAASAMSSKFAGIQNTMLATPVSDAVSRQTLFAEAMAVNREAMFANPAFDFDTIIANIETFIECRMVECARAAAHANGGGPVMITGVKGSSPKMTKILSGIKVSSGPWAGKELTGKFAGLELSFDAKEILFSATTNDNLWHIFKYNFETKKLDQLTSGPYDDFDPCFLPSGRIVFVSTRREGIGRCLLPVTALLFTLHSMESDGSDIIPISYHETNDWQPSVANDGMIVYNRWDYFDRHWGTAHHLFLCYPDGRDPRNWHGNYPLPHDVMPNGITPEQYGTEGGFPNGRNLREDVDMTLRAVPGSNSKFVATAVGHHEGFSGTLIMIDINIPDDGKMSQVKRLTPEVKFPEVEMGSSHTYGTCWPLSETSFMCNYKNGLYLIDDKGNRQVIYDPNNLENQGNKFRLRDPFPFKLRAKPPVLAVQTFQGKRMNLPDHKPATIGVVNCYLTDSIPKPIPAGTKIKWMRIMQIIPQHLTRISGSGGNYNGSSGTISYLSFYDESTGRIPLGVVPVEPDGSVYCEAPADKALYFQLLDSNGLAVHSMRTVAYTHAGEQLVCTGCHESRWKATPPGNPTAFQRAPSKITPEVSDGAIPFNFHRLVEWPVFQTKCLPCHKQQNKGLTNMSYESVAKYKYAFGFQGEWGYTLRGSGGSRTTAGKFGASASGIWKALTTKPAMKGVLTDSLTKEEIRRLTLWLDMNSNRLCWIGDDAATIEAQRRGDVSWPPIVDVQPYNPAGIEYLGTDNTAPGAVPVAIMLKRTTPVYHMKLRWQVATDKESGVGGYKIYRNNTFVCMVPDNMYIDRTAVSSANYNYEISAVDRMGREGPKTKAELRDKDTIFGPVVPVISNEMTRIRVFDVHTTIQRNLVSLTISVPEGTTEPAIVTFFTFDGRLLGQAVAKQIKSGVQKAEFTRRSAANVSLCKVQAGSYKKLIKVMKAKW